MRLFALSDIHTDFPENFSWVAGLSSSDYKQDAIIIAGDVSDDSVLLEKTLEHFCARFAHVCFVPGNHDLWVEKGKTENSLKKWQRLQSMLKSLGVITRSRVLGKYELIPLLSWYDFSFGEPSDRLKRAWMDFSRCRWPAQFSGSERVCDYFLSLNHLNAVSEYKRITYSHFLPRIDIMPHFIPAKHRLVYPVLGTWKLDEQLRVLNSGMHLYGHSHVNRDLVKKGVRYINNAMGYPSETWLQRQLKCVVEDLEA